MAHSRGMTAPDPAPDPAQDDREIAGIVDWLLTDARRLTDIEALQEAICKRLVTAGVPLWRVTFHVPQLHPQMVGQMYTWLSDTGRTSLWNVPRQVAISAMYHNSPVGLMHRTGGMVRRRLAGPDSELDFPLLEELAEQGGVEYAMLPMPIGSADSSFAGAGSPIGGVVLAAFGMTTRSPDGFGDRHIAIVDGVMPAVSTVVEAMIGRIRAERLLDIYVGHEAGRRILSGQITIGTGRSIHAVILFCDLRGFTNLSETLPKDELLDLLKDYFACMVGPVVKAGGEVLKFLGDGMLAIFRLEESEEADAAAARALIAALEAEAQVRLTNERRIAAGKSEIRAGIALHVGTVIFGNIGAGERLDFTVIGPAVNLAARIEMLCRDIGSTILTSKAFADLCPVRMLSKGVHVLKGVAEPEEVFVPVHAAVPADTVHLPEALSPVDL